MKEKINHKMSLTKKIIFSFGCSLILLVFSGCENKQPIIINVSSNESIYNDVFGETALIKIGNGLWYDATTRIVYWWSGKLSYDWQSSTTPSPYYAPNGLPYRYNPETNTFEEISNELY
ncbi:MAG: hypothetical protein HDT44_08815 [Ruminococcaceae bacterium]|nr:hypothetical protein [Oscillospiraceae bacterium]